MKVAPKSSFRYTIEPELRFYIQCPYCKRSNEEKYWIKFLICKYCGLISKVPEDITTKMIKLEEKYGKPSQIY